MRTAELSRVNQDLEAFSYSAAHDLRGPLDRLAGFVEILIREMGEPSATVLRRVESVKRQVRHMTALIDDLLALASSSRVALHQTAVDMSVLVAEVREQLQADAEAERRNVQWIVASSLPPVRADRALLREALVNLLGNALKYTRGRDPAVIEVGVLETPAGPRGRFPSSSATTGPDSTWPTRPSCSCRSGGCIRSFRIRGHRHRPGHRAAHHRAQRRTGVGRRGSGGRSDLRLHLAGGRACGGRGGCRGCPTLGAAHRP